GTPPPALDIDGTNPSALPTTLPAVVRHYAGVIASATAEERAAIFTGEPDRLARVFEAVLGGQRLPPHTLVIEDDVQEWPGRWQSLLLHITSGKITSGKTPVPVQWGPAQPAPQALAGSALGTVQAALAPGFTAAAVPKAQPDDTLRVARCASKAVAAQAAASALAALPADELSSAVVICADDVVAAMIDAHLHAFGLPTMGIATASQTSGILAILPLAIEAVGSPADPARVKEFLALPESPISRKARSRLLKAIDDLPAVGSPAWKRVVRVIRTKWKHGRRKAAAIEEWIPVPQRWCGSRTGFDATALAAALARVSRWSNWKCRRLKESIRQTLAAGVRTPADNAELDLTVTRLLHFQALFARSRAALALFNDRKLSGLVDRATVMQLLDTVQQGRVSAAIHPDSAGGPRRVRGLSEIGDFLGPVSRTIWVGPVRSPPARAPWSQGDTAVAKSAHALNLDLAAGHHEALTRAEEIGLCHLSGSLLILAHPSGDPSTRPHPLWLLITEMLRSGMPAPQPYVYEPEPLDSSLPAVPLSPWVIGRTVQVIEPPPAGVMTITLAPGTALPRRSTVSHSDFEQRLTCPVAWAFKYGARLYPAADAALPDASKSQGTVGEQVLREIFGGSPPANKAAAFAKLDHVLRHRLPVLYAELCSPMARAQREEFERALRNAVPVLQALFDAGITITFGAQLDRLKAPSGNSVTWHGLSPGGAIDALGTTPAGYGHLPIIIDLKYKSGNFHAARLVDGTCTQLGMYASFIQLSKPTALVDSIGYLVISEGRLLVPAWAAGYLSSPALVGVVKIVGQPTPCSLPQLINDIDTRTVAAANAMHQPGAVLTAHPRAAAAGAPPHSDLAFIHGTDPTKAAESACRFCEYSLLCGKDTAR
ncbi:MAG: PD-(D/E)XK nuclease family protein, partial [Planctomycetia bacterium]